MRGSKDSLNFYEGAELYVKDFKIKPAMIPYAVKGQDVTAKGFVRDEPSLFQKVMARF
jgi:hypothetical protein